MKLRKLIALGLTAALGLSMGGAALAVGSADQRLVKVTQAVKATLGVEDIYTQFYGEPNETMLGTRWTLNWEGEDRSLNVTATEEGKVLSMNLRENGTDVYYINGQKLSIPAMTRAQAQERAQAFLEKVFTEGEAPVFDENDYPDSLGVTQYSFWGGIKLNGLASPLRFSMRVRVSDGTVVSFWRDDVSQYVGPLAPAETSTTADKAAEQLKTTLSLRLEYVRAGEEPRAVLRYLPEGRDDYYVDAATGKLVNLTELRAKLAMGADDLGDMKYAGAMAAPEAANGALSQVELEGIAKLEGTLDQEELDAVVRKWEALGLTGFELARANYQINRDTDEVTATLSYVSRKAGDRETARRTITVEAKEGTLLSMSGYNAYDEAPGKLAKTAAQKKAEVFLQALWGSQFAKTELYDSTEDGERIMSDAWSFTYVQKVNGYFFPANLITVRVSAADGSVMAFSKSFDDDVVFDSADGLISKDKALDVWAASFPVELRYVEVPVKLDLLGPAVKPLINAGYSYYNALKPGYLLGDRGDGWYRGVDAKTGELVVSEAQGAQRVSYDDISGHWAEEILSTLAQYNVGWFGGSACPDNPLTQVDYIALLASTRGYVYLPGGIESADNIYNYAFREGILTAEEREDGKVLTRGEMVKLLLNSLGYKEIASLPGIFRCDFTDADAIPQNELGYAALAQGLHLVTGDESGSYAAGRAAVRCEAAGILWNYLKG